LLHQHDDARRQAGKWVLETNDDTLSPEDAATGYKSLLVIERCFRTLKRTQIRLTPMYHWLDRRIEAHVKICVLALLIERVAELRTGQPWGVVRHALAGLQATEFSAQDHVFFQRNEPGPEAAAMLEKLGVKLGSPVLAVSPTTAKR
jgi:hypothetical protein